MEMIARISRECEPKLVFRTVRSRQVFSTSFEAGAAPPAICLNCSETTPN